MNDDRSTVRGTIRGEVPAQRGDDEGLALVICWSREEPRRIGEVAFLRGAQILGRGGARPDDHAERLAFHRQRPEGLALQEPIGSLRISRVQLSLLATGTEVRIESAGRCALLVNGKPASAVTAAPGDTIQLKNEMVFLVVRRPYAMPCRASAGAPPFEFGRPDAHGFVGESPAAFRLRDALAFAAGSREHVLVLGESGTGKELAARAIHQLSSRRARPLVSRNAATVPEGLIDAELFGNIKNYPNPGTAEREGLIGEADGSTLFLDEIGDLSPQLQAHLLRALDRRGEYQRLGDSRVRTSDFRLVAATNRPVDALKHDFAARLTLRIEVPPLGERREDVPLLIRHLLGLTASQNEHVARRFFAPAEGGLGEPRVDPNLVERLLSHEYGTHTRELHRILWQAIAESRGAYVELTSGVEQALAPQLAPAAPAEVTRELIEASLAKSGGNVTRTARELGYKDRFALYRVMKKLGVTKVG